MKRLLRAFCLCACLALLTLSPACAQTTPETAPAVRVLLRRLALSDRIDLTLNGLYEVHTEGAAMAFPRGAKLIVQIREGQLCLFYNGMSLTAGARLSLVRTAANETDHLRIGSASGEYPGDLTLTISDGILQPVLTIGMEDYLLGVIPYEMSDSFPLEALKAQAVCARTYAMGRLDAKKAWDVVDTTNDQVFKGLDRSDVNAARAIRETAGVVGMYKGQLAMCYYSASNGGQTELPSHVWGGSDPGCYAMTDDPYDLENPASLVLKATLAKRSPRLPASMTSALFAQALPAIERAGFIPDETMFRVDRLEALTLTEPSFPTPSRLFTQLTVTFSYSGKMLASDLAGDEEEWSLFATQAPTEAPLPTPASAPVYTDFIAAKAPVTVSIPIFPTLIRDLKLSISGADNELLTLLESDDAFTLEARRFGHGAGMSQRGAQWMASKYGALYDQILGFYYPGMQLVQSPTGTRPQPTLMPQLAATPGPAATPTPRPTLMPTAADDLPEGAWLATVEGIADNSSLNLRMEPNQAADILMRLYKHQLLVVLETCEDENWVRVKTDVIEGYVMKEFLEKVP